MRGACQKSRAGRRFRGKRCRSSLLLRLSALGTTLGPCTDTSSPRLTVRTSGEPAGSGVLSTTLRRSGQVGGRPETPVVAGRIKDEDIALVRERSAIVDVVGAQVGLRNAGGG